jgi:dTDP-4-amino-4,6-dideoxygalactose transaminase
MFRRTAACLRRKQYWASDCGAISSAHLRGPPDSIRYRYKPLNQQPIFNPHASACPNAKALTAAALQLPVHPGLSEAALQWAAGRVQTFAADAERPPA